eukprot:CAMPEP_0114664908 /NCGR_PEP_ID=MMETSP0191-20121206/29702_1 /TAXON_ID=126664 /ORGANISM="Sorites sp." /LENGTH=530 /DNA_ID=CAMNT_0001908369 /DNA_START=36 /DNA_END=1628 /DNA_ORIENTATION=-
MAALTKVAQLSDVVKPTVLTALGLVSLVSLIRHMRKRSQPGEDVPYASGWLPLVGHFWSLRGYWKDNQKLLLGRWGMDVYEKQKLDIFAGEAFGMTFMVVNDPDLAEEVCSGDPLRFTKDMRTMPSTELIDKLFGHGLFVVSTEDPRWQIAHNILKTPFSIRGMKVMMPLMCDQADALVETLKREVGYGKATYIDAWVTKMAFETIAVCGLGTSFGCFQDAEPHPYMVAFNEAVDFLHQPSLQFCPSYLRPLLFRGWPKFEAACDYMRSTCIDIIRKRREQGASSDQRRDLLDMMLHDKDPKTGQAMTEEMIVDNVLTFLFAGQDSTAAAMGSCLCFLSASPRCKGKLLKEIDEVVGTGQMRWEHLSQMPYLDWCIKETMRLVPPAVGFMRQARGDQVLGKKWRVPNGTPVIINAMGMHYSKALWGEDAFEFRPERWEHGAPHRFAYIPFAVGPRACTGREFTVVEQKVTMVKFFQHFDLRRPAHAVPEPGYITVKAAEAKFPPFIDMDVEFKVRSAFVGMSSSFELLPR